MRGQGFVDRVYRRLRNAVVAKGVILAYHRVAHLEHDPQLLSVTPERFDAQLRCLQRSAKICTIEEIISSGRANKLTDRSVALTFDDGYADNLEIAAPVLRAHGIPATVFVSTGFTGAHLEFFWDALERVFLLPGELPSLLHLPGIDTWTLQSTSYSSEDASWNAAWNVTEKRIPTDRHQIYLDLHRRLLPLPHSERQTVLESLYNWAGLSMEARATHRVLTSDEIASVPSDDAVAIGAHTVTHPQLSQLSPVHQRWELEQSFAFIRGLRPTARIGMSYPFGSTMDFTQSTTALAEAAGYDYACANIPHTVWNGTNRFSVPRVLVRNWDESEFERHLQTMFKL